MQKKRTPSAQRLRRALGAQRRKSSGESCGGLRSRQRPHHARLHPKSQSAFPRESQAALQHQGTHTHTPSRRSRWTSLALTHVFTTHGARAGACKPHCLAHGDPRSGGHSLGAQRHKDGPSYLRAQPWRTATQGWRRKDGPSAPARTQQLARLRTTVLYHCWQRPMGYADDPMLVAKQTDGRSALGRSHLLNVTA